MLLINVNFILLFLFNWTTFHFPRQTRLLKLEKKVRMGRHFNCSGDWGVDYSRLLQGMINQVMDNIGGVEECSKCTLISYIIFILKMLWVVQSDVYITQSVKHAKSSMSYLTVGETQIHNSGEDLRPLTFIDVAAFFPKPLAVTSVYSFFFNSVLHT